MDTPGTGPAAHSGAASDILRPRHPAVFASALTFVAGFLDAVGYAELNRLYVSFMSGNSTHLGMVLASGSLPAILGVLTIVAAFVIGAAIGTRVADSAGRHMLTAVLGTELLIFLPILALAFWHHGHAALTLVSMAMDLQNVLHAPVSGADVGKGFITGALFGLGQSLARSFRDGGEGARGASNIVSWGIFVGGAMSGTLAIAGMTLLASLALAAALLAAMAAGRTLDLL